MYLLQLLNLTLLSITFMLCSGDEAADKELQTEFQNMEGVLAEMRDFCCKNVSMKVEELKAYEDADEIPEHDLCFYKCFYEQLGLIDGKGKINPDSLDDVPGVNELSSDKMEELKGCIEGLGCIDSCVALREIENCFDKAEM